MSDERIKVGSQTIEISNPNKVLFPRDGITKRDLIAYYQQIADTMLPYMKDRPISMQRFPDGINAEGFYEKKLPDHFPDWIKSASVELEEEGGRQRQVVVQDAATLVYLANQACITPHTWLSRIDKIRYPDKLVFDFDPASDNFDSIRFAAQTIRTLLVELGLTPFVMTTGSRGVHVVAPLDRGWDFDKVRVFAHDVVEVAAKRAPDELTDEVRKNKRRSRVFLDYLRNSYAQTSVPPYAVRAKAGAPVATPLDWDELGDSSLNSQTYTITNIFRRLGQKGDPWKGMMRYAQSLDEPRRRLDGLSQASGANGG